jgi:hypothetical protein
MSKPARTCEWQYISEDDFGDKELHDCAKPAVGRTWFKDANGEEGPSLTCKYHNSLPVGAMYNFGFEVSKQERR